MTASPPCRLCGAPLTHSLLDLGSMPLANAFVPAERLSEPDRKLPLHAWVCDACFLVQVEAPATPEEIFGDYAYFSSFSASWVEHARRFAEDRIERLGLGPGSLVVEVASNDGYLLRHVARRGIPCLGIEPAANVAEMARRSGVPTETRFFGRDTAGWLVERHGPADLIVANNVLAHVPDLNDFIAGLALALKPSGSLSVEFPHLLNLLEQVQFDTIYHEHFSYFSLGVVCEAFRRHGLSVTDVEELPTHGGSLRVTAMHRAAAPRPGPRVEALLARERAAGLDRIDGYRDFQSRVFELCIDLVCFLNKAKTDGRVVVGYGAAAKGSTLLNTAGIGPDLLPFVVDRNEYKQGRWIPGARIPVLDPRAVDGIRPDYLLILPWNLRTEIMEQMAHIREWGGRFVTAVPRLQEFA